MIWYGGGAESVFRSNWADWLHPLLGTDRLHAQSSHIAIVAGP